MPCDVLLEARGLTKAYRGRDVLRGAHLRIRERELLGVVGENGSGKTTLVRVLAGLIAPDAGSVVIHGRIGYSPQEPQVFSDLTVREHFRYFAVAYGIARWEPEMERLARLLGFAIALDERVDRLSGGTRQKLNLALAFLHSPDILLLDEPYAAFDQGAHDRFWDLVDEARERHCGVLVISPRLDRGRFDTLHDLTGGTLRCRCDA